MSEPTKHENRTFALSIVALAINAVISLLVALIGAGYLVSKAEVIVETGPRNEIKSNTIYTATENGFVLVEVLANRKQRHVGVSMEVDGRRIGATGAQDNWAKGAFSISATTMTIPVKKGSKWQIIPNSIDQIPAGINATYISFDREIWSFW